MRLHQKVTTLESVVGFAADGWTRYLTLRGERAFVIGGSCETCAFMFERTKSNLLSPTAVADRLASGIGLLDDDIVNAAGSLLPTGDYAVLSASIKPSLTGPCEPDDYFSHESLDLFGMPAYEGVPTNPRTPYWRAGSRALPPGTGARASVDGPRPRPTNPKHFFHFVIPLEPPHHLDSERVAHYQRQLEAGAEPAALGVSVLDVRAPAVTPWDKDEASYEHGEHWCLATYLLDGHHKVAAAARSGRAVRLLMFIARDASVAGDQDVDAVTRMLAEGEP
ncbi:MAG: hypothetical protein QOJ81_1398 [Chloroflexota bacterium]|nr:hypothetical protein [Chloroflexota bacterium]